MELDLLGGTSKEYSGTFADLKKKRDKLSKTSAALRCNHRIRQERPPVLGKGDSNVEEYSDMSLPI